MEEIRIIKGKKEEKAFSSLATYCFTNINNWAARIFPLHFGDKAWGIFADKTLATGTITKPYQTYIFNTLSPMLGISTVASAPQFRNSGYVRKLFHAFLSHGKKNGFLTSVLMPFKHKFYEKFGYGHLGGAFFSTFSPGNILPYSLVDGEFVPFHHTKMELADIYDVHDVWVKNFTGGIKSRRLPLKQFTQNLEWYKNHCFLYYVNKKCLAYIMFALTRIDAHTSKMEIKKTAWVNDQGFRGIFHFLRSHRDQVRDIEWFVPETIPVHLMFTNPRISQKKLYDFMIRPLDVLNILTMKAAFTPAAEELSFSIDDPVLSDNKGTYIIEGNKVEKVPYNGENIIPFPVFSSLLFGAYTLKDALLAGLTNVSFPATADSFFQKDTNIYVSESF